MEKIEYTFCELREREIVNVADGKCLGRLNDMALNGCGKILGIIVPGEKKFFKSVTGCENIYIRWESILKIGTDVILVDLNNTVKPPHHSYPPYCGMIPPRC